MSMEFTREQLHAGSLKMAEKLAQCLQSEMRLQARCIDIEGAMVALVDKLDEVAPHAEGMASFCAIHGNEYDGPNYGDELEAAKVVLGRVKAINE